MLSLKEEYLIRFGSRISQSVCVISDCDRGGGGTLGTSLTSKGENRRGQVWGQLKYKHILIGKGQRMTSAECSGRRHPRPFARFTSIISIIVSEETLHMSVKLWRARSSPDNLWSDELPLFEINSDCNDVLVKIKESSVWIQVIGLFIFTYICIAKNGFFENLNMFILDFSIVHTFLE